MYHFGNYIVTEPPTDEPLTLAEVKTFLKVDFDAEDALINVLISAARTSAEKYCQMAIMPQTIAETFSRFAPWGLRLSISPLIEVEEITYKDTGGEVQTLSAAVYGTDASMRPPLVYRIPYNDFPATFAVPDAVSVVYQAGYADADAVPTPLKMAMLLMIAEWYDNRSDGVRTMPTASGILLNQYRVSLF
jgi:uncharacterized phiE125 gp8 family phage protein